MMRRVLFIVVLLATNIHSQGYICAVGGGSEGYGDWSDEPYGWIVQKADSGKIIIISNADATNWLPNYFLSLGAGEAYNKKIESRAIADLQSTYDELITAKAIFIRGGDQWDYINLWKGTKTQEAIEQVFQDGGVVAGTSAGLAVLGDVDFSAQNGSVYPDESLLNPFNSYMRFEDSFLNFVPNVLFDSHFIERARHGRLIAMLYNRYFLTGRELIGIGVDDRTAFCIFPDGIGVVMGSGAASIFTIDNETIFEQMNSGNYTIESLKCEQLINGWQYDLNAKEICYIPPSAKQVDTLRTTEFPLTDFWLTGSDDISQQIQINYPDFVTSVNTAKSVIISHPGFTAQLTPITNYLNQSSLDYEVIFLSSIVLNDPVVTQLINSATNFVFAGDSLNVLALLKDISTLAGEAFREKAVFFQTPIFFFGKSGKIAGRFYTDNLYSDIYAAYRGKMTNNSGLNLFGDLQFEPNLFTESDFYENRMSSVLWGVMRNRNRLGIYLHDNAMAEIHSEQKMIRAYGSMPSIFIDASRTAWIDSSTYMASGSIGPRQVVAMNNLRYNITTYDGNGYSIPEGRFESSLSIDNKANEFPMDYILYQNYPNPFNPITLIEFSIPEDVKNATITIYNILGEKVAELINTSLAAGRYKYQLDAQKLTTGIYIYELRTENFSTTKKMVLIK